jgi:hypothetical protein
MRAEAKQPCISLKATAAILRSAQDDSPPVDFSLLSRSSREQRREKPIVPPTPIHFVDPHNRIGLVFWLQPRRWRVLGADGEPGGEIDRLAAESMEPRRPDRRRASATVAGGAYHA